MEPIFEVRGGSAYPHQGRERARFAAAETSIQPLPAIGAETARENTLLFTAGTGDQFAGPLPSTNRPAFSYLLLGALLGWADDDGDANVTAAEAHQSVNATLLHALDDRRQTPQLLGAGSDILARSAGQEPPRRNSGAYANETPEQASAIFMRSLEQRTAGQIVGITAVWKPSSEAASRCPAQTPRSC